MNVLLSALPWFLTVQLLGLAVLPLTLRWLKWLPDQGYVFAKPFGILIVGYVVWLGASFGIVDNSRAAIALIAILTASVCWITWTQEARDFWRKRRRLIVGTELLFMVAFVAWVFVRSHDPAISATEKPMEIAFLSGTMRSAQFPPVDPWLSGHGISYYYFGYVMVNVLAKLAAAPATVAFNLAIPLLFALTVGGAFSLGYNIASRMGGVIDRRAAIISGLLSGALVAIAGNIEIVVEALNARGLLSSGMRSLAHIKDLPPGSGLAWLPTDNWWWFRATRVIGDFDVATNISRDYTINEFPYFSFLLGDLHPHVLALPFALMAIAAALNLLYDQRDWSSALLRARHYDWLLFALLFGGLGFLNSWDMPAYLILLALAFGLHRYIRTKRADRALAAQVAAFVLLVLVASIILYLPFYFGFRSQASGLGLVLVHTKLQHVVIFWAPLLVPAIAWLAFALRRSRSGDTALSKKGARAPLGIKAGSRAIFVFVAFLVVVMIALRADAAALFLILLVVAACTLLRPSSGDAAGASFVTLLALCAALLLLLCEWIYIRDFFNNRMNTVFKLYYQSWLMLAVAGGPMLYYLALRRLRLSPTPRLLRAAGQTAVALLFLASLIYPLAATWAKTEAFSAPATLDGMAFLDKSQPDEVAAIRWLQANVSGTPTIVEATGGSYGPSGRVAAFTGLPTLLGWDFHEQQWRGGSDDQRKRKADVDAIYSGDRANAERLLRQYRVSYVYVGPLERETYGKFGRVALDKFAGFMDVAYSTGGVTIYRVRG